MIEIPFRLLCFTVISYSDVFYCIFDRGTVWWYGNRSLLDHYLNFSPPKRCLMKYEKQYAASHRRIEWPVLLDVNVKSVI